MHLRIGLALLTAALLAAGCETGTGEVALDSNPDAPAKARAGLLVIDGVRYPFVASTCAIGEGRQRNDFLIFGEGGSDGVPYTINADGVDAATAVTLRQRSGLRSPIEVYRAYMDPQNVRVEGRTISGSGLFTHSGSQRNLPGEFTVSCN